MFKVYISDENLVNFLAGEEVSCYTDNSKVSHMSLTTYYAKPSELRVVKSTSYGVNYNKFVKKQAE